MLDALHGISVSLKSWRYCCDAIPVSVGEGACVDIVAVALFATLQSLAGLIHFQ